MTFPFHHLSLRYGNKSGHPVPHIIESLREGRVATSGKSSQGILRKNARYQPTIDLRANSGQIIAIGYLTGIRMVTQSNWWSGLVDVYPESWGVRWVDIFNPPLNHADFVHKFKIGEGAFRYLPKFHAHHVWGHEHSFGVVRGGNLEIGDLRENIKIDQKAVDTLFKI